MACAKHTSRYRTAAFLAAAALAACAGLMPGLARAAPVPQTAAAMAGGEGSPATCVVHSLSSFVAQGEFELQATAADIVEVECNPFVYGTGSKIKITASQLFG